MQKSFILDVWQGSKYIFEIPNFSRCLKTLYKVWLFPVDQRKKMRFNPLIMPGGNNSSYVLKPATKKAAGLSTYDLLLHFAIIKGYDDFELPYKVWV